MYDPNPILFIMSLLYTKNTDKYELLYWVRVVSISVTTLYIAVVQRHHVHAVITLQ